MRVALVSSVGTCGIAEHSQQLILHVQHADDRIEFGVDAHWLDPHAGPEPYGWDIWHLNYHRGLHSRWTPEVLAAKVPPGDKVIITFHDTYDVQPDLLPWELLAVPQVKAMIVHEPCDLQSHPKVHYWRQACPERPGSAAVGRVLNRWPGEGWRPTLGTLGFDFPWKNYDLLALVTGELGWNLRIVGHVSDARQVELALLNHRIHFDGFADPDYAVAALEQCDATAFLYNCANSGTSGAIRLGIAAGRPLIAASGCRQFRDLQALDQEALLHDDLGNRFGLESTGIQWREPNETALRMWLRGYNRSAVNTVRGYDTTLLALAHQESWPRLGGKYAALYQAVLHG